MDVSGMCSVCMGLNIYLVGNIIQTNVCRCMIACSYGKRYAFRGGKKNHSICVPGDVFETFFVYLVHSDWTLFRISIMLLLNSISDSIYVMSNYLLKESVCFLPHLPIAFDWRLCSSQRSGTQNEWYVSIGFMSRQFRLWIRIVLILIHHECHTTSLSFYHNSSHFLSYKQVAISPDGAAHRNLLFFTIFNENDHRWRHWAFLFTKIFPRRRGHFKICVRPLFFWTVHSKYNILMRSYACFSKLVVKWFWCFGGAIWRHQVCWIFAHSNRQPDHFHIFNTLSGRCTLYPFICGEGDNGILLHKPVICS